MILNLFINDFKGSLFDNLDDEDDIFSLKPDSSKKTQIKKPNEEIGKQESDSTSKIVEKKKSILTFKLTLMKIIY